MELDKFVAVPTEERLVNRALELLQNGSYWAGIVFQNLGAGASEAPPHVKYKIRMDVDEVEGTKKLKDRCVPLWVEPGRKKMFTCCVSRGHNLRYRHRNKLA